MALDTTVAGAAANSYLTLAEADALAAIDPIYGTQWLAASDADQEKHLIAATIDVDTYKRTAGPRYATDQALLFPRAIDVTGDPLEPYLLTEVKRATYEQAAYLLDNAHLIAQAASHRAHGLLSSSDDDGGWTAALSPTHGLYAPKMTERLDSISGTFGTGRTIQSVRLASSYPE